MNLQTAALGSVVAAEVFEPDDPVDNALNVPLLLAGSVIVRQENGAILAAEIYCFKASNWRRKRSGSRASRRNSDSESNTSRLGRTASTCFRIALMVAESSTSPGYRMVYCSSF